jgi:hypothetical protein
MTLTFGNKVNVTPIAINYVSSKPPILQNSGSYKITSVKTEQSAERVNEKNNFYQNGSEVS